MERSPAFFPARLFQNIQSRREALQADPENQRRIRVAVSLLLAGLLGTCSSEALKRTARTSQLMELAPRRVDVLLLGRSLNWTPADEAQLTFPPPDEEAGSWWWEVPARRLWYIESRDVRLALAPPKLGSHPQKNKPQAPRYERIGSGWHALPQILNRIREAPEVPKKQGNRPGLSVTPHPKEWRF
jgi:hypothetical protein